MDLHGQRVVIVIEGQSPNSLTSVCSTRSWISAVPNSSIASAALRNRSGTLPFGLQRTELAHLVEVRDVPLSALAGHPRSAGPTPSRRAAGEASCAEGATGLALRRAGDEGGEYQADVPTAGVIAGHIWCDVRHLQVSGIDVVQDYGTVQCFALLPAQLL